MEAEMARKRNTAEAPAADPAVDPALTPEGDAPAVDAPVAEAPAAEKAPKKPKDPTKGPEGEALVLMTKDGEDLYVNPACIQSHKDAGWKVA